MNYEDTINEAMNAFATFLAGPEGIVVPVSKGYPRMGRTETTAVIAGLLFDGFVPDGRGIEVVIRLDISCVDEVSLWTIAGRLWGMVANQREVEAGTFFVKAWPVTVDRQETETEPYRISAIFRGRPRSR